MVTNRRRGRGGFAGDNSVRSPIKGAVSLRRDFQSAPFRVDLEASCDGLDMVYESSLNGLNVERTTACPCQTVNGQRAQVLRGEVLASPPAPYKLLHETM